MENPWRTWRRRARKSLSGLRYFRKPCFLQGFYDCRTISSWTAVRIKKEIAVMQENLHPNLLKVLDADPDSKWFVSKYYSNETLDKPRNRDRFTGDLAKSLRALRPLVQGVSELHKRGIVHRDIKPQNIFNAYRWCPWGHPISAPDIFKCSW